MRLKSINDKDFVLILVTLISTSLLLIRLFSDYNEMAFVAVIGHNIDFLVVWLILMIFVMVRQIEQTSNQKIEMNKNKTTGRDDFNLNKGSQKEHPKKLDQENKDLKQKEGVIRSQNTIINSLIYDGEIDRANNDLEIINSSNQLKVLLEIVENNSIERSDYEEVIGYYVGVSSYNYIRNIERAGVNIDGLKTLNHIEEVVNDKFRYIEVVNYGLSVTFDSEHHESNVPVENGIEVTPIGFEIINSTRGIVIKKAPVSK